MAVDNLIDRYTQLLERRARDDASRLSGLYRIERVARERVTGQIANEIGAKPVSGTSRNYLSDRCIVIVLNRYISLRRRTQLLSARRRARSSREEFSRGPYENRRRKKPAEDLSAASSRGKADRGFSQLFSGPSPRSPRYATIIRP